VLNFDCFVSARHITGRGCSTKDKVFFKECETHSFGDSVEKMCFCSFFLCNDATSAAVASSSVVLLAVAATVAAAAAATAGCGGIWPSTAAQVPILAKRRHPLSSHGHTRVQRTRRSKESDVEVTREKHMKVARARSPSHRRSQRYSR